MRESVATPNGDDIEVEKKYEHGGTMNCMKEASAMVLLAMTLGVGLGLFGCSKSNATVATQLAAKMGADEVTLYEVDRAVARLPAASAGDVADVRKRVVDELIDQHLMADDAIKLKLDRLPDTVSDVQLCRLSTLQNADLTSILARPTGDAQSAKADAQSYYDHHPEIFADRKIYWIRELVFPKNAGIDVNAAEKLATPDFLALLEQRGVKYRITFGQVSSDKLSPELLTAANSIDDGHVRVINISDNVIVLMRVSATSSPLDFQAVEPEILQFLANQQTDERLHTQIASLRSRAGVQYMNEFASAPVASDAGQGGASETGVSVVDR